MAEVSLYGVKTFLLFVFVGVGKVAHTKSHKFERVVDFMGEAMLDMLFLTLAVMVMSGFEAVLHDS